MARAVQIPVLAYLLKVSQDDARPRVERVLEKVSPPYCPRGEFFPSLGFVEANTVLDSLAASQIENGTPLAADAAEYLGKYGSASMKPIVWEQFSRWHKKYAESGAELRMAGAKNTQEDWQLYNLDSRLLRAYVNAQGWTLSPEDVDRLSKLIGQKNKDGLACTFSCGSQVSIGPAPGNFSIYGRVNDPVFPVEDRIDYLMPMQPFHYSVNQYHCRDLKALEQKVLQFPTGSTFSVAHNGDLRDGEVDWTDISAFLKSRGYSFRN